MSKPFAVGSLMIGLVLASAGVLKCQTRLMAQDIKPVQPAPIGTINDLKNNQPASDAEKAAQAKRAARLPKWDYKIVQPAGAETSLNELGNEGWELVGVTHDQTGVSWAYFKRPR